MTTTARQQRILNLLRDNGSVRLRDLHLEFGVTSMTVWRDLRVLAEQGLVRRVRGGAQAMGGALAEPDFEAKLTASDQAKARIAVAAVKTFVNDGDVIAMEGGTTVAALVDELPRERVSVLTNSLPVALRLRARRPGLPVQVVGGWLSAVSGNTTGPDAVKALERQQASVCFISATGWDAERGPLDPNPLEIEAKRALAGCAARVVMLLDSEKFTRASASVTLHVRRLYALVTDAEPPSEVKTQLEAAGVRIIVAP
jgi:DeoR/GlpR family transcriptional regulator of sugar metabolism